MWFWTVSTLAPASCTASSPGPTTSGDTVLAAIEPVWDGNETWLIAAGGVLFLSFPKTYAAAFSGFYMALDDRALVADSARNCHRFPFATGQPALARILGHDVFARVGHAGTGAGHGPGQRGTGRARGRNRLFHHPALHQLPDRDSSRASSTGTPCWSACSRSVTLAGHGGFYLAWKTTGPVGDRSRTCARNAWSAVLPLWVLVTLATAWIQPEIYKNLLARPWSLVFVLLMLGGFWGGFRFLDQRRELAAFLSSSAFLLGLLGATMAGNYPYWMRSTLDPAHSLTAANTAAETLRIAPGATWWTFGITLALAYFAYLFRSIRGKVGSGAEGHGY